MKNILKYRSLVFFIFHSGGNGSSGLNSITKDSYVAKQPDKQSPAMKAALEALEKQFPKVSHQISLNNDNKINKKQSSYN